MGMFIEYLSLLADLNGLGPGQWVLEPGMGFGDETKWWGQRGPRGEVHNGIDLKFYREDGGAVRYLDGKSLVPVMSEGEVINIVKDFLGSSVFVSHGRDETGATLVSAYGHMVPVEGLEAGMRLQKGDIIGNLSEYEGMPVPPHLHISLLRVLSLRGEDLNWQGLEASVDHGFLDPLVRP